MISYLVLATGLAHHLVDEAQRQSGVAEELLSLKVRSSVLFAAQSHSAEGALVSTSAEYCSLWDSGMRRGPDPRVSTRVPSMVLVPLLHSSALSRRDGSSRRY